MQRRGHPSVSVRGRPCRQGGVVGKGNPRGRRPSTDTPARAARSKAATMTVATTTAIKIPGTRGWRLRNSMRASVAAPIMSAVTFVLPASTFAMIPHAWRSGPFALTEKPRSFGTWLSSTVSAMPFM